MKDISVQYAKNRLSYDENTGDFTWKNYPPMGKNWNAKFAGKRAGAIHGGKAQGRQRRRVMIDRAFYMESRLVWLFMTGDFPTLTIDHIDRNPMNNSWKNLRLATLSQQIGNQRRNGAISGYRGVRKVGNRWIAKLGVVGKKEYLGTFDTKDAAYSVYRKAAVEHWGDFFYDEHAMAST